MAKELRPLGDRLVVKPGEPEETTASGLVLPDTAAEKPQQGTVIVVGPGRVTEDGKTLPIEVIKDDTVIYAKFAGTEYSLDDEDVLILRESDVLAVVE
jgi:chaperonin GroES